MQVVWALVRMVRMVYYNIMFMYIFMKQWKYIQAFFSVVRKDMQTKWWYCTTLPRTVLQSIKSIGTKYNDNKWSVTRGEDLAICACTSTAGAPLWELYISVTHQMLQFTPGPQNHFIAIGIFFAWWTL